MKVYNLNEIMQILQVSRPTVIRYIKNKKLKAFRVGNAYRITEEALREYIESEQAK